MRYCGYWTDEEITVIIRKLYLNMGRYISDFLRTNRNNPSYRFHNFEIVDKLIKKDKGIIALLAHIGNWEYLAQLFGKRFTSLHVIAKPMKNRYVDNWLAGKRTKTGVKTIYTQQALRKMLEVIKDKGIIAILIDQHAGVHGTMVPFLGKDANTVRTVAGLVYKTRCSVLPVFAIMQKDGTYDIFMNEAELPDLKDKTSDQCIEAIQKQHNEIISEWIRQYPEHYFGWFHKRYRGIIPYK
jgi:KDO2-lipid IV(A) lauroyltransferase